MKLFKKKRSTKTPVEMFMDHLDATFEMEPEFYNGSNDKPGVTSMVYNYSTVF